MKNEDVSKLEEDGFRLFPAAHAFLSAFGGQKRGVGGRVEFDPGAALVLVEPERILGWGRRIGREVCPVGIAAKGYQIVLIDTEGVLYVGFDEDLRRLGLDTASSLEALLANRSGELLPMHPALSVDSLRRLEAAGWHEGRCVDVSYYREMLAQVGFLATGEALCHLREFGGLEVPLARARLPFSAGLARFDPVAALAWVEPRWVHAVYAPGLGRPLYPVGFEDHSLELLLIDENEVLYGGLGFDLYRYGPAADEGLEVLVSCGPRETILREQR